MEKKVITFPRSYKLTSTAVNSMKGYVGLYFIYLDNLSIPYPFKDSRLIYIGKSDSKQYSIGGRLKDHMTGTGNPAVYNYNKEHPVSFTSLNFEIVKSFWSKSIEELENYFINDFLLEYGSYPICNNKSSTEEIKLPTDLLLDIHWDSFSPI